MNPQTRSLLIERVIDSLALLAPGSIFEQFSVVLVEKMLDIKLVPRGLNVAGSPVGGALDAVSEDGRIVVEASIKKSYFAGAMEKAWGDLDHTLALAPHVIDIYLLSSQRAQTGVIEDAVNTALMQDRMVGRKLHLMDSRAIAETIIDTLMFRDDAIDDLSQHLHVLADIRDDHPASLVAPQLDRRYVPNETIDSELDRRLQAAACVEICGIGGTGKSLAAAACLRRNQTKFHYSFWVSGRDINSVEHLSSVPVRRGGAERNVTAFLKRDSTLLVIDDAAANLDVERLSELCGPDSKIVVTRQNASMTAFVMPMMDVEQARALLNREVTTPLEEEEFQKIWGTVGGHPQSLALLNTAARQGISWKELAQDCVNVAKWPVGDARLADRILGRLRAVLEDELCVFQWAGHSHCDREFLKHVLGPVQLKSFEQHGLTAPESAASIRVHDIVFKSLQSLNWLSVQKSQRIDAALEDFILQQIRADSHGLQLIASQLRQKIFGNVVEGNRRPALLYALAMVWTGNEQAIHLLPDPLSESSRLRPLRAEDHAVSILVVLETIETNARYLRQTQRSETVRTYLARVLPAFDDLAAMGGLTARQSAEIKHHRAKAMRTLGRGSEARTLFAEVIASYPLNDAKLQFVRSLGDGAEDRAISQKYSLSIIADKLARKDVSPSLWMALGDTLNGARKTWAGELMQKHEELFLAEALYSAAIGIPQGYHSVANFVRALVWHAPERVAGVLERLPEPSPWMLNDDQCRGGYAEVMLMASGVSSDTKAMYLSRALEAYEELKAPNLFHKRKWGETLHQLGRSREAEAMLENIDDSDGRLWVAHSLSQVKLELSKHEPGKLDAALALAEEAVVGAVGKYERYRSSFLLQLAKVKIALGDDPSAEIAQGYRFTDHSGLHEQFRVLSQQYAEVTSARQSRVDDVSTKA